MAEQTIEQLQQEKETLEAKLATAQEYIDALEVENAELKAVAARQETEIKVLSVKAEGASDVITAEHAGKVYQVLGGAYVPSEGSFAKLSAADIAASPEVLAHLVKIDSGILKEVK